MRLIVCLLLASLLAVSAARAEAAASQQQSASAEGLAAAQRHELDDVKARLAKLDEELRTSRRVRVRKAAMFGWGTGALIGGYALLRWRFAGFDASDLPVSRGMAALSVACLSIGVMGSIWAPLLRVRERPLRRERRQLEQRRLELSPVVQLNAAGLHARLRF